MKRNKHPYALKETLVLSNGSTKVSTSLNLYKKYSDQTVDIYNNNKWNPILEEDLGNSFKGQHLKFRKRYNLELSN